MRPPSPGMDPRQNGRPTPLHIIAFKYERAEGTRSIDTARLERASRVDRTVCGPRCPGNCPAARRLSMAPDGSEVQYAGTSPGCMAEAGVQTAEAFVRSATSSAEAGRPLEHSILDPIS
jgi:hypothetical protein